MRVVSGKYRGRKLVSPDGAHTRPTLDRIKENLFNLLPDLFEKHVLDLFAGSGALGFEALSRGVAETVFVDNDVEAVRCIKKNLERVTESFELRETDVFSALKRLSGRKFDLILLDPPYHADCYEKTFELVSRLELLADGGILAVESAEELDFARFGFSPWKSRRYGAVLLTLLTKSTEANA